MRFVYPKIIQRLDGSQFDKLFKHGEKFKIGELDAVALSTPGHTPACMTYYIENDSAFVGDTIFMPDQGTARCDFIGGSAETLWNSIQTVLSLPEHVRIYVGHDYGGLKSDRTIAWETTVGDEKKNNVQVKEGTEKDSFITWRASRDASLGVPKLIIPSLQVNMNAGKFVDPKMLKYPVNLFKPNTNTGVVPLKK